MEKAMKNWNNRMKHLLDMTESVTLGSVGPSVQSRGSEMYLWFLS